MYIDAIEVIIRMTKGDGDNMPDTSSLKAAALKKSLALSIDKTTLKEMGFTHYRVTQGGEKSASIEFQDGIIIGYPTLKVRVYAYPDMGQVMADVFGDDRVRLGECFSYKVNVGLSEFYFVDANGYTQCQRMTAEMKTPEFFDEKIRHKAVEL